MILFAEKVALAGRADEALPELIIAFDFAMASLDNLIDWDGDGLVADDTNSVVCESSHDRVYSTLSQSLTDL